MHFVVQDNISSIATIDYVLYIHMYLGQNLTQFDLNKWINKVHTVKAGQDSIYNDAI